LETAQNKDEVSVKLLAVVEKEEEVVVVAEVDKVDDEVQ
jgi:hypothetical protein